MSHFEYIAVAFSLVFALILSRLLESLPSVFRSSRRYWVHALWTVHMIFSVFGLWWALWEFRDTTWTPVLFLGVMTFPVILYMRTIFLLQDHSEGAKSWEVLFFENRRAFFSTSALAPIAALIFDLSVIESEGSAQAWRLSGYPVAAVALSSGAGFVRSKAPRSASGDQLRSRAWVAWVRRVVLRAPSGRSGHGYSRLACLSRARIRCHVSATLQLPACGTGERRRLQGSPTPVRTLHWSGL